MKSLDLNFVFGYLANLSTIYLCKFKTCPTSTYEVFVTDRFAPLVSVGFLS